VTSETAPQHLVLFDGVCSLCSASVDFIIARDPAPGAKFVFASLQSTLATEVLARNGAPVLELNTMYLVENYGTANEHLHSRAHGVLRVLTLLGGPFAWVVPFTWMPAGLLNPVYALVASTRYKLFGKKETCRVPTPEERARILA
jgi:predicted DCC family thiol-disulfide oxidoreductase YuxK